MIKIILQDICLFTMETKCIDVTFVEKSYSQTYVSRYILIHYDKNIDVYLKK